LWPTRWPCRRHGRPPHECPPKHLRRGAGQGDARRQAAARRRSHPPAAAGIGAGDARGRAGGADDGAQALPHPGGDHRPGGGRHRGAARRPHRRRRRPRRAHRCGGGGDAPPGGRRMRPARSAWRHPAGRGRRRQRADCRTRPRARLHHRAGAGPARVERRAVLAARCGAVALRGEQLLPAPRRGARLRDRAQGDGAAAHRARYRHARRPRAAARGGIAHARAGAARRMAHRSRRWDQGIGMSERRDPLDHALAGHALADDAALALTDCNDLGALMEVAAALRDRGHGANVSYSRKVFIPLTKLCRDSCHSCTFAHPPHHNARAYLTPEEVMAIARAGAMADCKEALFTLGDKPELRYRTARDELARLGHDSTISYLAAMAALVLGETGLLPHLNPGVMSAGDVARLREVSVSQGLMLETSAERLSERGGPHFGSPDKRPSVRLATIRAAGEVAIPFTSGILIGIGETRRERVEALVALRDLHRRYGHLQEIIIQNFRAKPDTRMAEAPEPALDEHLWTIAVARILFGPEMNIQAPPNLRAGSLRRLIDAGINDWGGVSPVTPDHVNPEHPWPQLDALARATAAAGK